jgi:hypothetical protein
MMTADHTYASPAAFRRALTDRLRALAKQGKWTLTQLQRQMAYDRLLERLYAVDDGWIIKGATALLARDLGMRATIDVDLYRARAAAIAEADLRAAASQDIGDGSGSRSATRMQWAKVSREFDFRSPHMSGPRPGRSFTLIWSAPTCA